MSEIVYLKEKIKEMLKDCEDKELLYLIGNLLSDVKKGVD